MLASSMMLALAALGPALRPSEFVPDEFVEPSIRLLTRYSLSRGAPSASRASLRILKKSFQPTIPGAPPSRHPCLLLTARTRCHRHHASACVSTSRASLRSLRRRSDVDSTRARNDRPAKPVDQDKGISTCGKAVRRSGISRGSLRAGQAHRSRPARHPPLRVPA
jgi:hypothetical protein